MFLSISHLNDFVELFFYPWHFSHKSKHIINCFTKVELYQNILLDKKQTVSRYMITTKNYDNL